MNGGPEPTTSDDRAALLIERALEGGLSPAEAEEFRARLHASPAAREQYWDAVAQHVLIEDILREARGRDLAAVESGGHEPPPPALPAQSAAAASSPAATAVPFTAWQLLLGALALSWLVALGILFAPRRPAAAPQVAQLRALSGRVQIRGTSGDLRLATSGAAIAAGEAVVVDPEEGTAEIDLPDGSRLTVDTDSWLRFAGEETAGERLHLERGGIQVDALPQPDQRPLLVATDHALVTVQGTRFRLYSDPAASRVELNEGKVQFQRQADGQSVEVPEGYFAVALAEPQAAAPLEAKQLSQVACRLRHTLLRAGQTICIAHDGLQLATIKGRHLRVWDRATGSELDSLADLPPAHWKSLAFAADDQSLVALSGSGLAAQWARGAETADLAQLRQQHVRHGAITGDGRMIVQGIGGDVGEVAFWNVEPQTGGFALARSAPIKPWTVAATSSAGLVAVGHWDGTIDLLEANSAVTVGSLRVRSTPWPLALADDARQVAAFTQKDGLVLLDRSAGPGQPPARRVLWPAQGARVACLRFSRDGRLLLAGMDDGLVRVWSTASGESLLVLETGDARLAALDLAPDGSWLATASRDECVKIWDCEWPALPSLE